MVCGAVSSRSAPHSARHADPKEFCLSDLRREADLDTATLHRVDDCAGEKGSWNRESDLRAFGWCRFIRSCRASRSGTTRRKREVPLDLRFCKQRRAAQERVRKSPEDLTRQARIETRSGRCYRPVPEKVEGR